jgi:hypothetical protein
VTDSQAAYESGPASEQVAPAGVTDHEDGWSHARSPEFEQDVENERPEDSSAQAPAPEPEQYAGNGLAEAPVEAVPRAGSFGAEELASVRARWREIQGNFVDEPRSAVQDADALVAELMQRIARMFAAERDQLESGWVSQTDVSTEDLRQGLQRYRSFFERLLAACPSADQPPSTAV